MNELSNHSQAEMLISDDFSAFQGAYLEACDAMYTASSYAYECYKTYGNTFRSYATGTMNISESTFSKMIKAGEIIRTNPNAGLDNMEYSKIYELKDVQGELGNYQSYVKTACNKEIDELSQREIKKTIKDFWAVQEGTEHVVIKEETHPQTAAPVLNKWDELEDAIINGVNTQGLLKLFYSLKEEVTKNEK